MSPDRRAPVEFEIRRMTEEDAPAVDELVHQLGYPSDPGKTETAIRAVLGTEVADAFVAVGPEGNVIGWAHVFIVPFIESGPNAELGGLVVDEKHRGSGAGRALVERVEAWARERGAVEVSLRTNIVRDGAHKFYKHLGFEVQKTQHKFRKKLGPGVDGSEPGAEPDDKGGTS